MILPVNKVQRYFGMSDFITDTPKDCTEALERLEDVRVMFSATLKNPQSPTTESVMHKALSQISVYSQLPSDKHYKPIYAYLTSLFQPTDLTVNQEALYNALSDEHKAIVAFLIKDVFSYCSTNLELAFPLRAAFAKSIKENQCQTNDLIINEKNGSCCYSGEENFEQRVKKKPRLRIKGAQHYNPIKLKNISLLE